MERWRMYSGFCHGPTKEKTFACIAHDISERKQIERLQFEFSDVMRRGLHVPLDSIQTLFRKMELSTDILPPRAVAKAAAAQKEYPA